MCELLGMSFSRPIRPTISFRGFLHGSQRNPDGWGIACYPDAGTAAMVVKEPKPATESPLAAFVAAGGLPPSSVHVIHIRKAGSTGAETAYRNCHPFLRTVGDRDYVFAHNGTLREVPSRGGSFLPMGETDSERAFCNLLARLATDLQSRDWRKAHEWLCQANAAGPLNCLLSDGESLLAYRDKNGKRDLHMVKRVAPFPVVKLSDEDFEVDLGEVKSREDFGYVVATRPLTTGEQWESLKAGELIVFRAGEEDVRLGL